MSEFDKKISQLTGGAASQATDEYVINRGGANFKITGANVAAAATSVGTLSSLTVSGDLTVDSAQNTFKVDSTNNRVGILTASPAYALDLASGIARFDSSGGDGLRVYGGSGTNQWDIYCNSTNLRFSDNTGGGSAVFDTGMTVAGDLGVGTASPGARIDANLSGTAPSVTSGTVARFVSAGGAGFDSQISVISGNTGGASIFFGDTDADNRGRIRYSNGDDAMLFFTAATEAARIDASGNLGVGISPAEKLQVNGSIAATGALKLQRSSGSLYLNTLRFWNGSGNPVSGGAQGDILVLGNQGGDSLVFATNDTERARITSGGNLWVAATTESNLGTTNRGFIVRTDSANQVYLQLASSSGSSVPHIYFYNSTGLAGSLDSSSATVSLNNASDYRLKKNIAPIASPSDRLAALKPCEFEYLVTEGEKFEGFIAHELQAVVPQAVRGEKDAVTEDGEVKPQMVDITKLIPLLTAALQESMARIEALEASNAGLLARLEALEA